LHVPVPLYRRPTDWERSTQGLESAQWITADMSYRRSVLQSVGGFDERFPRAFREDSDIALRVTSAHGAITRGRRTVAHPVRPADDWASVRQQAGNADDALMRRLHGRGWRDGAGAAPGRRPRHLATTAAGVTAVAAAAVGSRRVAGVATAAWAAGTAELAWARIAPGPRDRAEVRRMLVTSAAIPVAATWHTARGLWMHRNAQPWRGVPDLVLFDRDGTLVHDVPYNGDASLVRPVAGARQALDRLRAAGVKVGIASNQSGVASGRITLDDLGAVNDRVVALLGPFDTVQYCTHGAEDGCECRKPAPGLVKQACHELSVTPARCVVVGDIGSDVLAAVAAGATGVLVPTAATRGEEIEAATTVRPHLASVVDDLLAGRW
jgi:HAD superfamily hydrolase (TIGR01662 family)